MTKFHAGTFVFHFQPWTKGNNNTISYAIISEIYYKQRVLLQQSGRAAFRRPEWSTCERYPIKHAIITKPETYTGCTQ